MRTEREIRNEVHRLTQMPCMQQFQASRLDSVAAHNQIKAHQFTLNYSSEFIQGEDSAYMMIRRYGLDYVMQLFDQKGSEEFMLGFQAVVEDFRIAQGEGRP